MQNYVDVAYDEKEYPRTAYPEKLARYLYERFEMQLGMEYSVFLSWRYSLWNAKFVIVANSL